MSTALTPIRELLQKELSQTAQCVDTGDLPRITTGGKVFTLPNGVVHQGPLQCVILDFANINAYFPNPYDDRRRDAPVCTAYAKFIHDLVPDPGAEQPQALSCAECDKNRFGSAPNGKGKACSNKVRLAIAPIDKLDAVPDIMLIDVMPSALRNWAAFLDRCRVEEKPYLELVTEIFFVPTLSYPSLDFKRAGEHDKLEAAWAARERAQKFMPTPVATATPT